MARLILDGDRPVRIAPHDAPDGVEVGDIPRGVSLSQLRWTGSALVDLATLDVIHVEPGSHVLHAHAVPGSQPVAMTYADRKRLVTEDGVVRLRTDAERLAEAQAEVLARLDRDTERHIHQHPDGSDRYRAAKQNSFNALATRYRALLDDPATPAEVRPAIQAAWDKLQSVLTWISLVLEEHYAVRSAVLAAPDEASARAVTWDFSWTEAHDPRVTLKEVMI